MKIYFSHLKKFIEDNVSINDISNCLFQLGHENDYANNILDIEFTPNKGDCLSVMGLARDINPIHKTNINVDVFDEAIDELDFNFDNHIPNFCPKISFLKIDIDNIPDSYCSYLEDYFVKLGNKKVNFFTDISNYIAYELGQPIHCYDYKKVKNGISLEKINHESIFKSLLGDEINIKPEENTFMQNNKIINLPGIIGGDITKCTKDTKSSLVECAFFNPDMIIGKNIEYGINSDAAYRFERGVDLNAQEHVLRRFIKIVQDHTNISSVRIKTFSYHEKKPKRFDLDHNKINKILGTSLSNFDIENILTKLGFKVDNNIEVPSWRSDINNTNDLSEEIARVIGYDNIRIKEYKKKPPPVKKFNSDKINLIRNYLINEGFNEVINDPFDNNSNKSSIRIDNPLDKNKCYLRSNLLDSLIRNLEYNEKRQRDSIKIFEISDIYLNNNGIYCEPRISIIISGRQGNNYKLFNKKLDKSYLSSIVSKFTDVQIEEISRDRINSKVKNKVFAIESKLDDINIKDFDLPLMKNYEFVIYKPISELPSTYRDLSISIKNDFLFEDLIKNIFRLNLHDLEKRFIFDFYRDKNKKNIKIGFRFIFRSNKFTLKDGHIDEQMNKVYEIIDSTDGVEIPGLNR